MNACEYLAQVGFDALLGEVARPARRSDHRRVYERLLAKEPSPMSNNREGALWLVPITWPDRVPGLKCWAGQVTLPKIIAKLQAAVRTQPDGDLFELRAPIKGASGIDALSCPSAIDVGFSVNALGMAVVQRPAMEMLAIYGLETLPLVSFAAHECGFIHDGFIWRFPVEGRGDGHYRRWGNVERIN